MTSKLALMGAHISRSKMGKLQAYLAQQNGLSIDYGLIDGEILPDFNPEDCVKRLIAEGYHGINVTHPYKQSVYPLVKSPLAEGHEKIGSYNTLRFTEDGILGANTDYSGFKQGYLYRRGDKSPGKVLVCGAGGVGRAIMFALTELGADHLYISDINTTAAQTMADLLVKHGHSASAITPDEVKVLQNKVDGLVNCTALGMYGKPGTPFDLTALSSPEWAFDAVYVPLKTDFIKACETAGLQCVSGFDLWIFQGIDAYNLFFDASIAATPALINEALSWLD